MFPPLSKKQTVVTCCDNGQVIFYDPATGGRRNGWPHEIPLAVFAAMTVGQYERLDRHVQRHREACVAVLGKPPQEVLYEEIPPCLNSR